MEKVNYFFIFLFSITCVSAIGNTVPIQIQVTDNIGNIFTGTYEFTINISNSSNCSPVLYSNISTLTTDARGIVSYDIELNLPFDEQYYLCYYRDGILKQSKKIGTNPYSFRSNVSDYWDDIDTINTTQLMNLSGNLNIRESWLTSLYCKLTGCTMTGDIDLGDNSILNVNTINITNNTYVSYLRSSDGNSIYVLPSGDVDDSFSFKTVLNRPTIKREGGKYVYFESSNVNDVGISFRQSDTYSGTLNYEKDNNVMTMLGKNSPLGFKSNSEYNNYILFETFNHQPQISVFNGTKLLINDSLEVIGYGKFGQNDTNYLSIESDGSIRPYGTATYKTTNGNSGITGNYTNGNCWFAYQGGIMYETNCTSV